MQVLKDNIRNRILEIAERYFYEQGFIKTSTRQIARELDMSVSNLYRYFKNKEDIFDAVIAEYYEFYQKSFLKIVDHENDEKFHRHGSTALAQKIFGDIKNRQVKFVILMDKSKGTRYENAKEETIRVLTKHLLSAVGDEVTDEYITHILMKNFFYGIIEIAKQYENHDWVYQNIKKLVDYHITGVSALYL